MRTRTTLSVVLGIALVACRSETSTTPAPAVQQPWAAAWSRAELTQRTQQLSEALNLGTASLPDVLEFTTQALKGLDPAEREVRSDGSIALKVHAQDGVDLGSLRVLAATAGGVRTLQLSIDTEAQDELMKFDDNAGTRLELSFGFGPSAFESCTAQSKTEYDANMPMLKSITEKHPILTGGTLRVDRQGACTWRGRALRLFKEPPPWRETESELQPRATASLADGRVRELQQLLELLANT